MQELTGERVGSRKEVDAHSRIKRPLSLASRFMPRQSFDRQKGALMLDGHDFRHLTRAPEKPEVEVEGRVGLASAEEWN